MARRTNSNSVRAQLNTKDSDGKNIRRSFSNINNSATQQQLVLGVQSIVNLLSDESPVSLKFTTTKSINL